MSRVPSFMKKALEENAKKSEILYKSLKGERLGDMGDPCLHWATGGYVRGGANLLYGPSKSGKSTLALKYAAQEQQKKENGVVLLLDTENALVDHNEVDELGKPTKAALQTRQRFTEAGLDPDRVLLWKSNRATELFVPLRNMEDDLEKDPQMVAAIIIDSWEGIQSDQAAGKIEKGDAGNAGNAFGGNSKTINPILKSLVELGNKFGVTVFSVQHVRSNMDQYGPKYLVPGGQTFMHLHHMVILIEGVETKAGALLEGDEVGNSASDSASKVGKLIRFKCDKSRVNTEGRNGEVFMNFKDMTFAKAEDSLFDLATRIGVVVHPINEKTGKENNLWWQFPADAATPIKWQGKAGAVKALTDDKKLYNEVWTACLASKKKDGASGKVSSAGTYDDSGKLVDVSEMGND